MGEHHARKHVSSLHLPALSTCALTSRAGSGGFPLLLTWSSHGCSPPHPPTQVHPSGYAPGLDIRRVLPHSDLSPSSGRGRVGGSQPLALHWLTRAQGGAAITPRPTVMPPVTRHLKQNPALT